MNYFKMLSVFLCMGVFLIFFTSDQLLAAAEVPSSYGQLTFIGTADLQGHLDAAPRSIDFGDGAGKVEVVGGISRLAALIAKIKADSEGPVVVVSAGDDLMGRYFHTFGGKAIFDLLGVAGYEILALGNHEFDRGPGVLGEALEKTAFVTLCSDLAVAGTALEGSCRSLLIKKYGDISVGFFSLMTPEFSHVTSGGSVSLNGSAFTVAEKMVAELRRQGADLVVAVTHIGAEADRRLATGVKGIDIIFGGHSHSYFPKLEEQASTLIVNGGEKGAALVRLNVELNSDKKIIPEFTKYSLIPVTEALPEDSAVAERLQQYASQLPKVVVLGHTDVSWGLDKHSLRSGESAVADMINDLILEKFQVDLVLNNGGAFRGNKRYAAGAITDRMLHAIDEFENDVYLVKIKGKYLREILEHSAAQIGGGGFLQVAGIRMVINPEATPQILTSGAGQLQVSQQGKRLLEVHIRNGQGSYMPLDPEKLYAVASNSFLAQKGGDEYFWFKRYGQDQVNTYTTLYSILAERLHGDQVLNPPSPDQRIRFVTSGN